MDDIKFRRKIASQGDRKVITIPPALKEMLDFDQEYLVVLKHIKAGG